MSGHPRERRTGLSRREFLRRSIGAAAVLPSASAILAACSKPGTDAGGNGGGDGQQRTGPGAPGQPGHAPDEG